ncbi:MAG: hypothetical protein M1814_000936 [Vezdaea aestivalis]|nr:MAG: hypothetical protein M1814_000936 [Vezdaea aestivalis]
MTSDRLTHLLHLTGWEYLKFTMLETDTPFPVGFRDKVGSSLHLSSKSQTPQAESSSVGPIDMPASDNNTLGPRVLSEGTNPIVESSNAAISLVFLHGLTGDRDGTWTAPGCTDPWPKTLLAEDLPQARIISYGYDANVVHLTKEAGLSTVREHASSIIFDLHNLRIRKNQAVGRAIIFVVHNLGGLVCEDALMTCNNPTNQKYKDILDCVRGIAFFGTPHAGADLAAIAKAATRLIGLTIVKKPNSHVLGVLERNSELLANIENDFSTLVRRRMIKPARPIEQFVFLEEKPVQGLGRRVVEPESAKIKGYGFANIPADHMKMTKFAERDTGYNRILGLLQSWIEDIESGNGAYPTLTLLNKIDKEFNERGENRSKIVILQALGVAIDYYRYCKTEIRAKEYCAIFFPDASSEDALQKELIALVETLKRPKQTFGSDEQRLNLILEKFRTWNRNWLLVFYNYDNSKTFPNLEKTYIPHGAFGAVLITSRYRELNYLGSMISIPAMTPDEAIQLLSKASNPLNTNLLDAVDFETRKEALKAVEKLGYLPLAINQAAAYIRRTGCSFEQFASEYNTRKVDVWSQKHVLQPDATTVYTTWELSYDLIYGDAQYRVRKGAIFAMLAFLDFRGISREIFNNMLDLVQPPWLQDLLREDGNWDFLRIDKMLDDFHDLSLVQISERARQGAFRIALHPLVAEWIKWKARADGTMEIQCLAQASVLVVLCMKALVEAQMPIQLSSQAQQEVTKHYEACMANLDNFRSSIASSNRSAKAEAVFVQSILAGIKEPQSSEEQTITLKRRKKPYDKGQELPADHDPIENQGSSATSKENPPSVNAFPDPRSPDASLRSAKPTWARRLQDRRNDQSIQQRDAILNWLTQGPHEAKYKELWSTRAQSTGMWLLRKPQYENWTTGVRRTLLLVGKAGCGKSTLM